MLTIRDLTHYEKYTKQQTRNESSSMVSSTVTQDMLLPLSCMETFLRAILNSTDLQKITIFAKLCERTSKALKLNIRDLLDRTLI